MCQMEKSSRKVGFMGCVTPMFYLYPVGDKRKGKIIPRTEVMGNLKQTPNAVRECLEAFNAKNIYTKQRAIQVPCNKCWACQLRYSAEWATRIMLEAKKYENNYFITLTYDNEHLPIWESIQCGDQLWQNDGTWIEGSLDPEESKKFMKDLRNYFQNKKLPNGEKLNHHGIKYYYCGEYGSGKKTGKGRRPHYHIILMNAPLDIQQFYDTSIDENFKAHWRSHELEAIWGKGRIDVAELEWSCAAYVARYCTKKLSFDTDKSIYYAQGKLEEFTRSSKGIGMDYFNEHMNEIYEHDEIIARTVKNNLCRVKPPRAFDKKFKELDPRGFELIKRSRMKAAERTRKMMQEMTDYTDKKMLEIQAESLTAKMNMLPRDEG